MRDILNGRNRNPKSDLLLELAAPDVLDCTLDYLTGRTDDPKGTARESLDFVPTRALLVRGTVAAGLWQEAWDEVDTLDPEDIEKVYVPTPAGYERAQLYALRVRGRSMDLEYPDGSIIIVCPVPEAEPRENDHVIVLRRKSGLVEATVKELIQVRPGRWALQARSSDPAFADPILIDPNDGEAPEITGVVVGSYRSRQRPAQFPSASKGR